MDHPFQRRTGSSAGCSSRPVGFRSQVKGAAYGDGFDLIKASREVTEKYKNGVGPYAEVVAGWTTEEIRKALDESLANKDFLLNAKGARSIATALLAEWLKRDCDAASAWFLSIDSATIKTGMILSVSHAWPAEQAEKGLSFLSGHPEIFNGSSGWSIILKTMEKRALEGPQAVVALLRELREAKLGVGFGNPANFPESFDFPPLMNDPEVTALLKKKEGEILVRAWHAQDRDAVFRWLLDTQGAKSLTTIGSSPAGEIPGNGQAVDRQIPGGIWQWVGEGLHPSCRQWGQWSWGG